MGPGVGGGLEQRLGEGLTDVELLGLSLEVGL